MKSETIRNLAQKIRDLGELPQHRKEAGEKIIQKLDSQKVLTFLKNFGVSDT